MKLHGYTDQDHRNLTQLVDTFALAELNGTLV
jgi:hypothetical protein